MDNKDGFQMQHDLMQSKRNFVKDKLKPMQIGVLNDFHIKQDLIN